MAKWLISFFAIFSVFELSKSCENVEVLRKGDLTCREKQQIVKAHNKLRMKVANRNETRLPQGINIFEMFWDNTLEKSAQKWAEKCDLDAPIPTETRFDVGQNVGRILTLLPMEEGDKPEFDTVIDMWYNELASSGGYYTENSKYFTQIVWGDTYLIGCGYVYYKEPSKYTKLHVCQYGPAGNVKYEKPYDIGKYVCNKTRMMNSPKYHGLCRRTNFKNYVPPC